MVFFKRGHKSHIQVLLILLFSAMFLVVAGQNCSPLSSFTSSSSEVNNPSSSNENGGSSSLPDCDPSVTESEVAGFQAAADYSDSFTGYSVLIKKCGKIVFERYSNGATVDQANTLASGTKSFTCAFIAAAEEDGYLQLNDRASDTITEWQGNPAREKILLRHLLSLSSGLQDSPQYNAIDAYKLDTYDLAINDSREPYGIEEAFIYMPGSFQLLAAVFERKSQGQDPLDFLYRRVLSPLGVSKANLDLWTRDLMGKPQMAGGARFTTREWSNYGQFFIQEGNWQGIQIVSWPLLKRCLDYNNPTFAGYGLSWWLNIPTNSTYDPSVDRVPSDGVGDGDQVATNAPTDMYVAAGSGKQRLYVIPSKNLVIVRMGALGENTLWSDHEFLGKILGNP